MNWRCVGSCGRNDQEKKDQRGILTKRGNGKRGVDCGRGWSGTAMKEKCRDQIRQWQEIVNV